MQPHLACVVALAGGVQLEAGLDDPGPQYRRELLHREPFAEGSRRGASFRRVTPIMYLLEELFNAPCREGVMCGIGRPVSRRQSLITAVSSMTNDVCSDASSVPVNRTVMLLPA